MKKFATGLVALCLAAIGCGDSPKPAPKTTTPMMTAPANGGNPSDAHTPPAGDKKEEMKEGEEKKSEATEPAKTETPADTEKKDGEEKKEEAK